MEFSKLNDCVVCGNKVGGKSYKWAGHEAHFDCFKCDDCSGSLANGFRSEDGPPGRKSYRCGQCYAKRNVGKCALCDSVILDEFGFVELKGKNWHSACIVCLVCKSRFGYGERVWNRGTKLYCTRCRIVVTKPLEDPANRSPLKFMPEQTIPKFNEL